MYMRFCLCIFVCVSVCVVSNGQRQSSLMFVCVYKYRAISAVSICPSFSMMANRFNDNPVDVRSANLLAPPPPPSPSQPIFQYFFACVYVCIWCELDECNQPIRTLEMDDEEHFSFFDRRSDSLIHKHFMTLDPILFGSINL